MRVVFLSALFLTASFCGFSAHAEENKTSRLKQHKAKKIKYACSDRKDNDRDGFVDYPKDPGCKNRKDNSERNRKIISPSPTATPGAATPPGREGVPALGQNASLQGLRPFPDDNAWNTDVSSLPVDPNSQAIIASIGELVGLHPDFGTTYNGAPNGIPYVVVDGSQPKVAITFNEYGDESDPGPYPVPLDAPIEGGSQGTGDRHVLVIDRDAWKLYELYHAIPNTTGWSAGSGAVYDLTSNALRPLYWTSADAAGLPIFPGLVRYDEVVELGEIRHALRFTVSRSRRAFVPPARHFASSSTASNLPPMGMRVRLKQGFDESRFSPEVQVILRALKKYGMIVADNGSNWFISGAPDPRWNDDRLRELGQVKGQDFEVILMQGLVTN